MATPSYCDGEIVELPFGRSAESEIAISYPTSQTLNPHGFSGAGLWMPTPLLRGDFWAPHMSLIGIVTNWARQSEKLIGYKIETIIEFLKSIDPSFYAQSSS